MVSLSNHANSCPVEYPAAIPQGERLCGEIMIASLVAALPRWVSVVEAPSQYSRKNLFFRGSNERIQLSRQLTGGEQSATGQWVRTKSEEGRDEKIEDAA